MPSAEEKTAERNLVIDRVTQEIVRILRDSGMSKFEMQTVIEKADLIIEIEE